MKTGITKLNQLQVVVALLAFGLLAGASGSAAAAPSVLRDKSRRAALRSQIPRSRFGRQAPAHDAK
jgi:hypothetical protein